MRRKDREVTDPSEIQSIIKKADVCRIALVDNNQPYIVTLNFGYQPGNPPCLYFHCANEGRKIDIIKQNNSVCFQMDIDHELFTANKACGFSMSFKSIVGTGKIFIVNERDKKIEGLNCIMKQYTDEDCFDYEDKMLDVTTILRLEIDQMTAKQKL